MLYKKASILDFNTLWKGDEYFKQQFLSHIENENSELWLVIKEDEIVGNLYIFKQLNDKDIANGITRAYITNFFISPKYRGQGIGTELLKNVFSRMRSLNFFEATIGVDENESRNILLYNKMGFINKIKYSRLDPICINNDGKPYDMSKFLLLMKKL